MTDLNELKLEHYRQVLIEKEEQIANLRAQLTQLSDELNEAKKSLEPVQEEPEPAAKAK